MSGTELEQAGAELRIIARRQAVALREQAERAELHADALDLEAAIISRLGSQHPAAASIAHLIDALGW